MKQKAFNIQWDTDNDIEIFKTLPKEIDIPENIVDFDDISDYISDQTGYCHSGYDLAYQISGEIFSTVNEINNFDMIQSKIKYNDELILILNKKGAKYIFSDQKYIDNKDTWYTEFVPFKYHNHYISLYKTKNGQMKYIGHAWYSPTESYIQEFYDLKSCVKWLTDKE